jgi:hypothetical protein
MIPRWVWILVGVILVLIILYLLGIQFNLTVG